MEPSAEKPHIAQAPPARVGRVAKSRSAGITMSRVPTAHDVLRAHKANCENCGRAIELLEDRDRCADCGTNCCLDCGLGDRHSGHAAARLAGFPELAGDLHEIARRSSEIFSDLRHRFTTGDNIYFGKLMNSARFLARSVAGEATFPDSVSREYVNWLNEHGASLLRRFVSLKAMGRFVDYFSRRAFAGRLADGFTVDASQGTVAPLQWRGVPMMRTAWDFALLPMMIQDIRPKTVIELGTAEGGAAAYAADLQRMVGLEPRVLTVDLSPPALCVEGVTCLKGDSHRIADVLMPDMLERQPHPWLLIEDSHANIAGLLQYFHGFLRCGDYLCIEDVDAEKPLFAFLSKYADQYKVDTHFTDFFGHNNTCCPDQIFRKMA
jgi:cephalosporin hydroxylase